MAVKRPRRIFAPGWWVRIRRSAKQEYEYVALGEISRGDAELSAYNLAKQCAVGAAVELFDKRPDGVTAPVVQYFVEFGGIRIRSHP